MLIPLGILAASGAADLSDYELIATAFGAGFTSEINFTSIPQDYKHLQIRLTAKKNDDNTGLIMQFNGDSTTSYSSHVVSGNGTGVSSFHFGLNQTTLQFRNLIAPSTTANLFSAGIIDILDYTNTSKNTTIRSLNGYALGVIALNSGVFLKTNAITSIRLSGQTGSITSASRFSLYGIKG
jgi:hypothetical protein